MQENKNTENPIADSMVKWAEYEPGETRISFKDVFKSRILFKRLVILMMAW